MDGESNLRVEPDCSNCSAGRRDRCAPFASAGREKCQQYPECCNWCRIFWCPSNRARELYASIHAKLDEVAPRDASL